MKDRLYGFRRWFLAAAFVLAAGTCYSCGREAVSLQEYVADESGTGDRDAGESMPGEEPTQAALPEKEESTAVCYVHICGAVVNPGVYEVGKGQRIYQVVERAGGYTQDAAADYLNLAAEVSDGMKLTVPTREELSESGKGFYGDSGPQDMAGVGNNAKINLNTAAKEQLMELSGIGETKAGDIIRYREEHGGFKTIEDIMKVPGIKDAAFQKIKDEATV